jgi:hypothetical protein
MRQTLTLWKRGALDGNGEWTYLAPVEVPVRWEDKVQRFQHQDGSARIGNCVIYLREDRITLDDKVFHGHRNAFLLASLTTAQLEALSVSLGISVEALTALLGVATPIDGIDYDDLSPFASPLVRTVGMIGASPSVGNGSNIVFKIIAE